MRRPKSNRTQLVRTYLEQHRGTAFTAREVATAVAPNDKVDLVHATLANLARAGEVLKLGAGYGNVHFTAASGVPRASARPRKTAPRPASPPTVDVPRTYGQATPAPVRKRLESKTHRQTMTGIAIQPSRGRPRPLPTANFTAAPGTTDVNFCPARRASARIAADIAQFQANGGAIERLGPTVFFHPADAANDADDDQP